MHAGTALPIWFGDPFSHIRIIGLEVMQQKFGNAAQTFIDLLKEFKHYRNDTFVDAIRIEIIDKRTGEKTVVE